MNEQLRKAIEDATRVEPLGYEVDLEVHYASQAKLLRVIELLVEQRDSWIKLSFKEHYMAPFEIAKAFGHEDAELIAALEGKP